MADPTHREENRGTGAGPDSFRWPHAITGTDDLLLVADAGAYGMAMASNYNSRNRPAEVMVDGDQAFLVRARETVDEQLRLETLLP